MRPLPVDYFMRATLQQDRGRFGGDGEYQRQWGLSAETKRGVWLEADEIERSAHPWSEN